MAVVAVINRSDQASSDPERKNCCPMSEQRRTLTTEQQLKESGGNQNEEYQHLIGTIVIAVAIVVAAVNIAGAIDGAGESIRSSLFQLGMRSDNFHSSKKST